MVNLRLFETMRPRFQNFRPRLKKIRDPKTQNHRKRDFTTYYKRFQDFETRPKFSETQIFLGNILYPFQCSQNHLQLASLGNLLPPRDQPNTWPRSTIQIVNMNILWKMITMTLLHLWRDYRCIVGELCEWRFFHKVRKTLINLIEELCFTKWD